MTTLLYNEEVMSTSDGESILDTLLRHDYVIPYGCRSGVCQSCLMVADKGLPTDLAQQGLSDVQKALGYFLSCQCIPSEVMHVKQPDDEALRVDAVVVDKTMLAPNVIRLRLKSDLVYQAGQYVTLWREDGVGRSYSLASLPGQNDFLEFHIKLIEKGEFSQWINRGLELGEQLQIQGPIGQCIYTANPDQSLLLTGIGTGLAPLYGILKEALEQGHLGDIDLVLGARESRHFYLVEELTSLSQQHTNLTIHFIAQDNASDDLTRQDIYQYCKTTFPDLSGWRVFICGADTFVGKMRKQCFLSGAGMNAISSDSFLAFSV